MFSTLSLNERDFIVEALKQKCRVSGRSAEEMRDISIKFANYKDGSSKNGQVIVNYGRTKILTQSHLKLCSPMPGKPQEGFFKFNVEFDSLQ